MTPERIQLKRTKGWRMPENTRKVDRSTRFGNPFTLVDRELSVKLFRNLVEGIWDPGAVPADLPQAMWDHIYACYQKGHTRIGRGRHPKEAIRSELRGKNLACWCRIGDLCHGDILLAAANAGNWMETAMPEGGESCGH